MKEIFQNDLIWRLQGDSEKPFGVFLFASIDRLSWKEYRKIRNNETKMGEMMFRLKCIAILVLVLIVVQPSVADDRAKIVGIWRLVSFEREYQATGEREHPMGKSPTGYILFLPEGRMAVVITGEGRKAPTTDPERAGLFNSLVAYTGGYRVDSDSWITKVDVSANPAWVGTEQTRSFRVTGDRLQEITAWAARPDNRVARAVITYERAK
jgi:hypothetical protein